MPQGALLLLFLMALLSLERKQSLCTLPQCSTTLLIRGHKSSFEAIKAKRLQCLN
eukprot:m.59614 g.59614  ORF g.59614 m.59614 type:complete len:55 (+) comp12245_c1_seq1:143-307(+)